MSQDPTNHDPGVEARLVSLVSEVLPVWASQLSTSRQQSEDAVSEMLAAFAAISPHLNVAVRQLPAAQDEALKLHNDIERMYVGFQYQDRVSQMMSLLLDDMQRMLSVLKDPAPQSPDLLAHSTWLARLEGLYAMAEQRRDHASSAPNSASTVNNTDGNAPADDAADGTVFF